MCDGCPVCRVPGIYQRCSEKQKLLDEKMVKCPDKSCTWAGKLVDYKEHQKSHALSQPVGRNALRDTIHTAAATSPEFMRELANRITNRYQSPNEQQSNNPVQQIRQHISANAEEAVNELNNLSSNLVQLASRLQELSDTMAASSRRYQQYVREGERLARQQFPNLDEMNVEAQSRLRVLVGDNPPPASSNRSEDEQRLNQLMQDTSEDEVMLVRAPPLSTTLNMQDQQRVNDLLAQDDEQENPFAAL
jgi:prophage DNA circulation protein